MNENLIHNEDIRNDIAKLNMKLKDPMITEEEKDECEIELIRLIMLRSNCEHKNYTPF
jgi:hypothetical protein